MRHSHEIAIALSILIAAFFALIGIWIIRKGGRRRIGEQPHCRKCEYLLIGIESDRCPECGGLRNDVLALLMDADSAQKPSFASASFFCFWRFLFHTI